MASSCSKTQASGGQQVVSMAAGMIHSIAFMVSAAGYCLAALAQRKKR